MDDLLAQTLVLALEALQLPDQHAHLFLPGRKKHTRLSNELRTRIVYHGERAKSFLFNRNSTTSSEFLPPIVSTQSAFLRFRFIISAKMSLIVT